MAPVPPDTLRKILKADGFKVLSEDELNWVLVKDMDDIPVILPKLGALVAIDVMMSALDRARITPGRFFELLREITPGSDSPLAH